MLHGGPGDDVITASESAGDLLFGDGGNDRLHHDACDGVSTLDGGDGHDTYSFESPFDCDLVIQGIVPGAGFDTLDQSDSAIGFSFDMAGCPACVEAVIGSAFSDDDHRRRNPQAIRGGAGDDLIDGGGGNDLLAGQQGDDTINSRDRRIDLVSCGARDRHRHGRPARPVARAARTGSAPGLARDRRLPRPAHPFGCAGPPAAR